MMLRFEDILGHEQIKEYFKTLWSVIRSPMHIF